MPDHPDAGFILGAAGPAQALQREDARGARAVGGRRLRLRGRTVARGGRGRGRHWNVHRVARLGSSSTLRRGGRARGPEGGVAPRAPRSEDCTRQPAGVAVTVGGGLFVRSARALGGCNWKLLSVRDVARLARTARRVGAEPDRGVRTRFPVTVPMLRRPRWGVLRT
eukprot:10248871-Alexandrium_andersonii.AAC.1